MVYSTLKDISDYTRHVIDKYWCLSITETELMDAIKELFALERNRGIIMRGVKFSSTFERKLGKKRMKELKDILQKIDPEKYKSL